jgi:hypothetical protein
MVGKIVSVGVAELALGTFVSVGIARVAVDTGAFKVFWRDLFVASLCLAIVYNADMVFSACTASTPTLST